VLIILILHNFFIFINILFHYVMQLILK